MPPDGDDVKKSGLASILIGFLLASGLVAVNSGLVWRIMGNPAGLLGGSPRDISDALTTILALAILLVYGSDFRSARPRKPLIAAEAERDTVIRRRRDAKRWNEGLKLLATFLNAIGASSFIALAIVPMVMAGNRNEASAFYGLGIAAFCHVLGQAALRLWKTEE